MEAEDSLLGFTPFINRTCMESTNALQISTQLEQIVKDMSSLHVNSFDPISNVTHKAKIS